MQEIDVLIVLIFLFPSCSSASVNLYSAISCRAFKSAAWASNSFGLSDRASSFRIFFSMSIFNPSFIEMEVLLPAFSKYQETLYPYLSLRHFRQESDPVCFPQFMLFNNNVHSINFNPVFVCVTARMQMSGNSDLSSLMKVFFCKLSVLSKGNAAEKICVLLSILMPVSSCNSKCIACCYGRFLFAFSILFLKCNESLAPSLIFQFPILCS